MRRGKPREMLGSHEFSGAVAKPSGLIDKEGSDEIERNGLWSHWRERYKRGESHKVRDELDYLVSRIKNKTSVEGRTLADISKHFEVASDLEVKHGHVDWIDKYGAEGAARNISYSGAKRVSNAVANALTEHKVGEIVDLPTGRLREIAALYKQPAEAEQPRIVYGQAVGTTRVEMPTVKAMRESRSAPQRSGGFLRLFAAIGGIFGAGRPKGKPIR
jgi:hypothetical protein